jgi:Protein of unknown function (DUF2997)
MAKPIITIVIGKKGNSTISVEGAKGSQCHTLTEGFERSLGSVESKENTTEYYEEQEQIADVEN